MTQLIEVTTNEVISGVCRAIYNQFGSAISIYKEKQPHMKLPAVSVYCINHTQQMERYDSYTNIFNIIINYFPDDSVTINNNRADMFSKAVKIMECIRYIELPSQIRNASGEFEYSTLPSRASDLASEEVERFIQISATYTIRTRKYNQTNKFCEDLQINIELGKK